MNPNSWLSDVQRVYIFHTYHVNQHGKANGGRPSGGAGKTGWSCQDTANHFKISLRNANLSIRLGEFLRKYPELTKLKSKRQAVRVMLEEGDHA